MSVVLLVVLLLAGSRAAPLSKVDDLHFWNSFPQTEGLMSPFREFLLPDDFTIIGPCLITILTLICNGTYATSNIDIDHKPYSLASSAEDHSKEVLSCKGNNCRLDKLNAYCNSPMQHWSNESALQQEYGTLPSHNNINPGCNRHNIDIDKVLREGGRSCMKKVDCLCEGCCYSKSKSEVLRTMLERKYTQLLERNTKIRKIRLLHPRKNDFRRPRPRNFPISSTTRQ